MKRRDLILLKRLRKLLAIIGTTPCEAKFARAMELLAIVKKQRQINKKHPGYFN